MLTLAQRTTVDGINDIYIDSRGVLAMSSGKESYADIISDRVRTIKGELPLNTDLGIDYFGTVFKSVTRLNIWKHYVKASIEELPFVLGITEFNASYNSSTKNLKYRIGVKTDEGTVTIGN